MAVVAEQCGEEKNSIVFQCIQEWDFDGIGTFHHTCSKLYIAESLSIPSNGKLENVS